MANSGKASGSCKRQKCFLSSLAKQEILKLLPFQGGGWEGDGVIRVGKHGKSPPFSKGGVVSLNSGSSKQPARSTKNYELQNSSPTPESFDCQQYHFTPQHTIVNNYYRYGVF